MRLLKDLSFFIFFLLVITGQAQESNEGNSIPNWDDTMYLSNKVGWGSEKVIQSAEIQSRCNDYFGDLEQWHLEYVYSILYSENIEITTDFRFTRKPERHGLGIIYKKIVKKNQVIYQI